MRLRYFLHECYAAMSEMCHGGIDARNANNKRIRRLCRGSRVRVMRFHPNEIDLLRATSGGRRRLIRAE